MSTEPVPGGRRHCTPSWPVPDRLRVSGVVFNPGHLDLAFFFYSAVVSLGRSASPVCAAVASGCGRTQGDASLSRHMGRELETSLKPDIKRLYLHSYFIRSSRSH